MLPVGAAGPTTPGDSASGPITGRRASIEFAQGSAIIRFHGQPPAGSGPHPRIELRVRGATVLERVAHPQGTIGRIALDGLAIEERTAVFADLPCAILEWRPFDGTGSESIPVAADIRFDPQTAPTTDDRPASSPLTDPGTTAARPDPSTAATGPGFLRIERSGVTLCLLSHDDARFLVDGTAAGTRVTAAIRATRGSVRLVIAAALIPGDDPTATLDAARRADDRIRARTATLRRRDRECISLRSPDPSADAALRDAVHRLDAVPLQPHPTGPLHIDHARAALAAGDFAIARAIIRAVLDRAARESATGFADAGRRLGLEFLARTGDPSFLLDGDADADPDAATTPDLPDAVRLTVRGRRVLNAGAAGPPPPAPPSHGVVTSDPLGIRSVTVPILALSDDLLGARPDAARGRFRLAPRMPAGWNYYAVANLPMADNRLALRVDASPGSWRLRIEQTAGAIPVTAILEPVIPTRGLTRALVDDTPAALEPRMEPAGLRIPVQLVLDRPRSLTLELLMGEPS